MWRQERHTPDKNVATELNFNPNFSIQVISQAEYISFTELKHGLCRDSNQSSSTKMSRVEQSLWKKHVQLRQFILIKYFYQIINNYIDFLKCFNITNLKNKKKDALGGKKDILTEIH